MALPKSHRLSLRFERERLTKQGKTSYGKYFTLVGDTAGSSAPKIAILLSKKTANLATDRNKIKRKTSAIVESLLPAIPLKDYLIIPKRLVLTEDYQSLKNDIEDLFQKVEK